MGTTESVPLRSSANQMSYFDKETFATDDALNIGRVHCMQEGWDDALVSFMQSGGFSPSAKVPKIQAPTLILWGRQDKVRGIGVESRSGFQREESQVCLDPAFRLAKMNGRY